MGWGSEGNVKGKGGIARVRFGGAWADVKYCASGAVDLGSGSSGNPFWESARMCKSESKKGLRQTGGYRDSRSSARSRDSSVTEQYGMKRSRVKFVSRGERKGIALGRVSWRLNLRNSVGMSVSRVRAQETSGSLIKRKTERRRGGVRVGFRVGRGVLWCPGVASSGVPDGSFTPPPHGEGVAEGRGGLGGTEAERDASEESIGTEEMKVDRERGRERPANIFLLNITGRFGLPATSSSSLL
ncbi:hypothetical protein Tco_0536428 [Tanacetum coccineum]